MTIQALILAGGKGTRLKPYTMVLPKPLMPVGDHPILEVILRQLKSAGVEEVFLAVGAVGQLFQAFFGDGSRYGLKIRYSTEDKPLGTAGAIGLLLDQLKENFLVMNGDLLTTLQYANIFQFHVQQKAAATIGLYERDAKIDFGVIETDDQGRLAKYIEKPTYHFKVSMGVNVFNAKAVAPFIVKNEYLDIPDLMTRLHQNGLPVLCYKEPCFWLDIGRVDDYQAAVEIFENRKAEFYKE